MPKSLLAVVCGLTLGLGVAVAVVPVNATACTADGCCRHCTRGKACGDTCIARDKQCHQAPGCACDYPRP